METKKFIDILEIYNGKNQKSVENPDGKYPIYGSGGVMGRADEYICPAETVVIGRKGSINNPIFVTEPFWNVDTAFGLVARKEVLLPKYLFYFCRYFDFEKLNTTVTIPSLTKANLLKIEIPIPSIIEQKSIVTKLNLLTDMIQQRQEQLTKLDGLIKARFVEMFGDPISNPFGFKVKTLQKMIDDGTIMYHLDGNHGSDYPRNEEFVECGVPYISANCIVHNDVNLKLAKHLTEERASKLRKGIAQNGDVLFAHNATVGPVAILYTDDEKVILGTSLTAYRCDKERMVPDYLKAYMQSEGFVRQYTKDMKQTTRNQVPITAQRKFLFVIPPLSLQNQFADFAAEVDKSKVEVQKALDQTQLLFDSLMQQYFG